MISFIMMAKNVENYIAEAVAELQKENAISWELIIIEDHSEDNTYEVVEKLAQFDERIILCKNPYRGKVLGTNFGFELSRGDIIKCIDSDDILLCEFFKEYEKLKEYDAHCHSALIVDQNLNNLGKYNVNTELITTSYENVVNNLLSLPKWSWSFKRNIAEKIFPMPANLPFEDVWMSIQIKKHALSVYNIQFPLYLYRQHDNQTFGGILNYNIERVVFRAKRLVALVEIIKNEHKYLLEGVNEPFSTIKEFLELQINNASIYAILSAKLSLRSKIKLILILHFPSIAVSATKLKWKLDKK